MVGSERRQDQPDNRPYFFLSYAHTPASGVGGDPNHWVHVLFSDLCDHIMHLTDHPAWAPAGFMDREMRSGDGWPQQLSENLAACRVFVPLLSPRYFTSEMCGREWFAFNERIVQARTDGTGNIPAIVPALWTRVDMSRLPDSVRHIHIDHAVPGTRYAEDGIYGLMKLTRLQDEYQEAVFRLAQRIVRIASESPLPSGRPRPYESTPSAFRPRGEGPRHLRLTVAAPTRHSVPKHRDTVPYGETADDWNPYPAESTRPLSAVAEDVIRALDYRITVSSFDDSFDPVGPRSTGSAARSSPDKDKDTPSGPVILLVDRWALADEERRQRLKAYDATAEPWVNAIVPWNRDDAQCQGPEGLSLVRDLERTLPQTLERGRRTNCRIAVEGVPTLELFTDVLPKVVANSTRRFLRHAAAHPPKGPYVPRPRLTGPLPASSPDSTSADRTSADPGGSR